MKLAKLSLVAAMVLGGLVVCSVATAQDTGKDTTKKGKKGFPTIEQQMEHLTTALTLTDDQKPKVKAVLEDSAKKRQAIMADTSLDRQQQREKMQPIMEEQNKKMKEILTADQFKKYEEMRPARGKKGPGDEKKQEEKKSQ